MLVSIGVSALNQIIGHIFMMQLFPSISGFDSGSRAHLRPESLQRFIYFNQIGHFVLMERLCYCQLEIVV